MPLPPETPELADLDLLLLVARLGSVGKAARAHGISQPSASARIQHVEHRLGLRLLERSRSGSRLTAEGVTVVQWAQGVIEAATELVAGARALRSAGHGRLRVAASMTVAEYLVPRWLVALSTRLPEVTVALEAANSRGVVELVRSGAVDVGFVEDLSPHTGLAERVVASDELVIVVAPDHPWARSDGPLSREQLATGPFIQREPGSGTRETLARVMGELSDGTAHLEFSSTTAIKEAVAAGAGAAALSILAVGQELRQGQLVRVPVEGVELRRKLRAIWLRGVTLSESATALLRIAERQSPPGPKRSPAPSGTGAER
ncbi:MAG: LysR family transcriptional regulator [Streptosporangiales bacterium]